MLTTFGTYNADILVATMMTTKSFIPELSTDTNEVIYLRCYFDNGTVYMSPYCFYSADVFTIVTPVDIAIDTATLWKVSIDANILTNTSSYSGILMNSTTDSGTVEAIRHQM